MPHIEKSGVGYLASKNFETVDSKGEARTATASEVEHGGVVVREKPGPKNSLGLIKFMFPNEYDIYLHSTPAPELFNRTRRDFSHGCVRVQKPDELGGVGCCATRPATGRSTRCTRPSTIRRQITKPSR